MRPERILTLPLKAVYFNAIRDGVKPFEYRLANEYWARRIVGQQYDGIVLTLGYPKRGDEEKRLNRPWRGYMRETITHPHFGPAPVEVFAIRVNEGSAP